MALSQSNPLRNSRLVEATHFNVVWAESNLLEEDNTLMTAREFYGLLSQIRLEQETEEHVCYCKVKFQTASRVLGTINEFLVDARSYRIDVEKDHQTTDLAFAFRLR